MNTAVFGPPPPTRPEGPGGKPAGLPTILALVMSRAFHPVSFLLLCRALATPYSVSHEVRASDSESSAPDWGDNPG
jgi:hypothetical protein